MNPSLQSPWPADAVSRRKVAELIPYARNAKKHPPEQVAQIAASIREWGVCVPILVDEDGMVIAGHGRLQAAQKLGLAEVPVMVAKGWTRAQKQAYGLADNKLTENGGWDEELLRVELGDLQEQNPDLLPLIGFSEAELEAALAEPDFEPVGIEDQGRLDEKSPVCCPKCGHEFRP
jgi:ParB-like chromosome segregation protein Spo0J